MAIAQAAMKPITPASGSQRGQPALTGRDGRHDIDRRRRGLRPGRVQRSRLRPRQTPAEKTLGRPKPAEGTVQAAAVAEPPARVPARPNAAGAGSGAAQTGVGCSPERSASSGGPPGAMSAMPPA